jgi:hypothetical protein
MGREIKIYYCPDFFPTFACFSVIALRYFFRLSLARALSRRRRATKSRCYFHKAEEGEGEEAGLVRSATKFFLWFLLVKDGMDNCRALSRRRRATKFSL